MKKGPFQAIPSSASAGVCPSSAVSRPQTAVLQQFRRTRSSNRPPASMAGRDRSLILAESACPPTETLLQNP